MNQLGNAVTQLLAKKEYHPVVVDLLQLIVQGKMNSIDRDSVLRTYNIRRISDIKEHTLPVILDYALVSLEDGVIETAEMNNVKLLKAFLGIEEGDFYRNKLQKDVETIITLQLHKIYGDGVVDAQEALQMGELQNLFGLSYDQFETIVKSTISAREKQSL